MLLGCQTKLLGFDGKGNRSVGPGKEHAAPDCSQVLVK